MTFPPLFAKGHGCHRTLCQALLHSELMMRGNILRRLLTAMAGLSLCLLAAFSAYADSGISMQVDVGEKVVFCEASLAADADRLARVLTDGTEVGIDWVVSIEQVQSYWLNSEAATVYVRRRVIPDLVSQSWQLLDRSTGITQRTMDVRSAVRFLLHLDHFSVLDRSLLEAGESYVMRVRIEERQGQEEEGWLANWWGYDAFEVEAGFTLP